MSVIQQAVRLVGANSGMVIFNPTPEVVENGSAAYSEIANIRGASSLLIYMGSPARSWTISGNLISRTIEEADENFERVSRMKAWRMPLARGAEPEVLRFSGYTTHFKAIPVVAMDVSITFSADSDYIFGGANPMPIVLPYSVTVKEARQKDEIKSFQYGPYSEGKLPLW